MPALAPWLILLLLAADPTAQTGRYFQITVVDEQTGRGPEHLKHLDRYEAFTCLKQGSRLDAHQLDRAEDGTLRHGWKKNTPPLGQKEQARLMKAGHLTAKEAWLDLRARQTGNLVVAVPDPLGRSDGHPENAADAR